MCNDQTIHVGDVLAAQAGNRDAFARLLVQHLPRVKKLLRTMLPSPEDTDDVAQEVCLHALVGIRGLRQPHLFGPWLRTVAYNRAMQWQRRRYAEQSVCMRLWGPDEEPSHEETSVLRLDVVAALDLLSPSDRNALLLYYVDEWTSSEIALWQGKPAGTVRWRLHQVKGLLRDVLTDMNDE